MTKNSRSPARYIVGCAVDLCGLTGLALGVLDTAVTQVVIISLTLLLTTMAGLQSAVPLDDSGGQ